MQRLSAPHRGVRIAVTVVGWFSLLSALAGVIGLTVGGGMGLPSQWLSGSVLTSYLWPGVILGVVVGGVQVLALAAQYGRYRVAWGAALSTGTGHDDLDLR
ncbi:MAG: putative rane protein [Microbacterium sp.]|jgi:hypothetical protein|nr:putative rane protein [Microbacterium sp.]